MTAHRIFGTPFASVYPHYVNKAQRKGRTKEEVDRIICWLTGYDLAGLQQQIEQRSDFTTFFAEAPAMHANRSRITGVVCGLRVGGGEGVGSETVGSGGRTVRRA